MTLPRGRHRVSQILIALMVATFLGRLWWLQIWHGSRFGEQARSRYLRILPIKAPRGTILDRNAFVLAENEPSFTLALLPAEFPMEKEIVRRLYALTGLSERDLKDAFSRIRSGRVPLFEPLRVRTGLDMEMVIKVMEHRWELPGILVLQETVRSYPFGKLAAHVLGHVGAVTKRDLERIPDLFLSDQIGKVGIEGRYDPWLRGKPGREVLEVDAVGAPTRRLRREPAKMGDTLVLTIDVRLQAAAEEALGGQRGAVVALVPKTGEVLVLASSPSFDPNWFSKGAPPRVWHQLFSEPTHPLHNRAIATAHPPGSTFKVVTAFAALLARKATPKTKLLCRGGRRVGRRFFRCWRRHGWVHFVQAIGQSCDTFFYEMGLRVGPEGLAEAARQMGLGQKTGIDLPGERSGLVPSPNWKGRRYKEAWYPGDTANFAIGQGYLTATPLQMALVACAIANEGMVPRPFLLKERRRPDGKVITRNRPKPLRHIPAPREIWATLKEGMLWAVYGWGGTARRLRDLPLLVAGKTGSAEHKEGEKTHAWFIAFAPADDPQIALAVLVEEGGHGSEAAVPVAERLLRKFVKLYAPAHRNRKTPAPRGGSQR